MRLMCSVLPALVGSLIQRLWIFHLKEKILVKMWQTNTVTCQFPK